METIEGSLDLQSPFGQHFSGETLVLLKHVEQAEFAQVDLWFEQHADFLTIDCGLDTMIGLIGLHGKYINYIQNPQKYSVQEKESIIKSRHLALFKHFPITEQLNYFVNEVHHQMWNLDEDYINVLNYQPHEFVKLQAVLANPDFGQMIGDFFAQNKFAMLDAIEKKLQFSVMDYEYGGMCICFRDVPQGDSGETVCFNEGAFPYKARDTIMIDYSPEKVQWFEEKGMTLPGEPEAEHFKKVLLGNMTSQDYLTGNEEQRYIQAIEAVRNYQKRLHYHKLSVAIDLRLDNAETEHLEVESEATLASRKMKI